MIHDISSAFPIGVGGGHRNLNLIFLIAKIQSRRHLMQDAEDPPPTLKVLPESIQYFAKRVRDAYNGVAFYGFVDEHTLKVVDPEDVVEQAINECWDELVVMSEKEGNFEGRFFNDVTHGKYGRFEVVTLQAGSGYGLFEKFRQHLLDEANIGEYPLPPDGPETIDVFSLLSEELRCQPEKVALVQE